LQPHAAPLVTCAPPTHFAIASGDASGFDVSAVVTVSSPVDASVDDAASWPASFECELEPPHPTTAKSEAAPTSRTMVKRSFRSRTK
jgi:hypothetical protein